MKVMEVLALLIGAGIGAGIYKNAETCFTKQEACWHSRPAAVKQYDELYEQWKERLNDQLNKINQTNPMSLVYLNYTTLTTKKMAITLGQTEFFKGISSINMKVTGSDNPLAYRWYDEKKVVAGKNHERLFTFCLCLLDIHSAAAVLTRLVKPTHLFFPGMKNQMQ
jgi:hypothetical protein